MITQTWAILLDAYRELNSKKLFWIVMALSLLVVLAFAMVGINEKGITILWFSLPFPINSTLFPPELFYKLMFTNLGVKFWLAWCSTILALIATAGIFPDLLASGSIELTLSKPISRARLFVTKFAAGLVFTTLQVTLFTGAAFLVLGIRGGVWSPGLFWTIPIMVTFYSYLFSICVLLGIVTRSTVASLLITLLAWFAVIFGVHTAERSLMLFRERNAAQVQRIESQIKNLEARVQAAENPDPAKKPNLTEILRADPKATLDKRRETLAGLQKDGTLIRRWHTGLYASKTVLPKTTETLDLLERVLVSEADMNTLNGDDDEPIDINDAGPEETRVDMRKVTKDMQTKLRDRSVWWIVGTSLGFEAIMLTIAGWLFCRREF